MKRANTNSGSHPMRVSLLALVVAVGSAGCGGGPAGPPEVPSRAEFRGLAVEARLEVVDRERGLVRVIATITNVASVPQMPNLAAGECSVDLRIYNERGANVYDEIRDRWGGACVFGSFTVVDLAPGESWAYPDQEPLEIPAVLGSAFRPGTYYLAASAGAFLNIVVDGVPTVVSSGKLEVLAGSIELR